VPLKKLALRALLVTAVATIACGGASTSPSASPSPVAFATRQSARFTFRYTAIDAPSIAQTAATVENEHDRITADLGVTQMPTVVVTLYPDLDARRQAVSPIVGPLPSFASGLVTGVDAVHIISPNSTAAGSYSAAVTNIVHEFAHCVSLRLNPAFANNPRWWWESVALFEAGQFTDPRTLPYFTVGPLPSFQQLNAFDNTIVYSVGAMLGRFVVNTRGWDAFRALVRTNGDLDRVLGTNEQAFLAEWAAFVRAAPLVQ
jgi:hypothetical protein